MRTRSEAVCAVLAISLVLASLTPAFAAAGRTRATAAVVRGGVLHVADEGVGDLSAMDPPVPQAGDAQNTLVENLVFGGLVSLDQNLHVQPNAASSWIVSDGGKVYTFTLRAGLKWGDGTSVTAQDVVWSLSRAFDPAYAAGNAGFYLGHIIGGVDMARGKATTVRGLKAVGTDKVQIALDAPAAVILNGLASSVAYLVPRAQVEKYGSGWTEHAAGLGPFVVKQWKHNQEIDLAPNPYYWRGKPKLTGVIVEFVKNPETAYSLYKTGALDVMGLVSFPVSHLKDVRSLPDYHAVPQLFTEFLVLNEHRIPLNNALVRQALSYAVNRLAITKLLDNRFSPASGMLPPGMPGFNAALRGETYNASLAKRLLAIAGYRGGAGLPQLTLNVDNGDNDGQTKAIALKELWHQVLGIDVTLNPLEHGAYVNALTRHDFDLSFVQWGADYPDPQDFLSLVFQTGSSYNSGFYSSARFDTLTRTADILTHDKGLRYLKYQNAEQVLLTDAGCLVLDWGKANVLISPRVKGIALTALGGGSMIMPSNWPGVTVQ